MQIEINKKILGKLKQEGVTITGFLLLLSLFHKEELFEWDDDSVYKTGQNLILLGYLKENFTEDENLYDLQEKAIKLLETIQNQ